MSKKIRLLIVIVAVAAVLGVVWFWQRPARVARVAIEQLGQSTSQHFTATIQLENAPVTQQLLGDTGVVELVLDGQFERPAGRREALATTVRLVAVAEGISLQLEGEVRFIDDKVYLLITRAPSTLAGLAQLKGKWLQLPRGGALAPSAVPTNANLFAAVTGGDTETIEGRRTIKYSANANQAAIVRMIDGIARLLGTSLTEQQISSLRGGLAKVESVPVELWITPWRHQLRQLAATLSVPGGNTVQFTLKLADRNRPVHIAVPEGAAKLPAARE